MQITKFPNEIQQYIKDMHCTNNDIGCSDATVYCFTNRDNTLYLKVEKVNSEFGHEQKIMKWLKGRLAVPQIIAQCRDKGYDYLLMAKMHGEMSCSEQYLRNPRELVRLLAEGIKMLQKVDISECPFDGTIKNKLKFAKERIDNNKININEWEESTSFKTPEELYDYLIANQPKEELVFTHGDYCLPNIFLENGNLSGFIDLGRAGIADKWQDIALCVRSLKHNLKSDQYTNLLFEYLDIKPDYEKINYYILLDELF